MDDRYTNFIHGKDACSDGRSVFAKFATVDAFLAGCDEVDHSMWLLLVSGLPVRFLLRACADLLDHLTSTMDTPQLRAHTVQIRAGVDGSLSALPASLRALPCDVFFGPMNPPAAYWPAKDATQHLVSLIGYLNDGLDRLYLANRTGANFSRSAKQCVIDLKLGDPSETRSVAQLSRILTASLPPNAVAEAIDRQLGLDPLPAPAPTAAAHGKSVHVDRQPALACQ